jgi:hypothetical protein
MRNNSSNGIVNLLGCYTVCHTRGMNTPAPTNRDKNHRFASAIISHAVWLYSRFCLSMLHPAAALHRDSMMAAVKEDFRHLRPIPDQGGQPPSQGSTTDQLSLF